MHDRTETRDRFFYYSKTLALGARWKLPRFGQLEVEGGYSFDRMFYSGQRIGASQFDRIDLRSTSFLGAGWSLTF